MKATLPALAAAAVLASFAASAQEPPAPAQGFVTITGEGVSTVIPELALVRLSVVTESASARKAFEESAMRVAVVVERMVSAGVPQSQIKTERFQVAPARKGEGATFQVKHVLSARVRGLTRLGELLERAGQAGANEVSGPEFPVDEAAPAIKEARQRAAKDAEDKARAYAQTLGIRLGRIVSVNEGDGRTRVDRPQGEDQAGALPIEIGRNEVRARVTVVWEIETSPPPTR